MAYWSGYVAPLGLGLLIIVMAVSSLMPLWSKRRKRKASEQWPLVPAAYENAKTEEVREGRRHFHRLWIWFSYQVDGIKYNGIYFANCPNPAEAERFRRSLENGPLLVRHHPQNHDDYYMDPYRDVRPTAR